MEVTAEEEAEAGTVTVQAETETEAEAEEVEGTVALVREEEALQDEVPTVLEPSRM